MCAGTGGGSMQVLSFVVPDSVRKAIQAAEHNFDKITKEHQLAVRAQATRCPDAPIPHRSHA
jgi:hypothetical protein